MDYYSDIENDLVPTHLYKRTLDQPNMTYMVQEIRKRGFRELDILIAPGVGAINIPKTMVFTDDIDEGIAMTAYLRSLLDETSQSKRKAIIRSIHSCLTAETRDFFIEEFENGNTRVLVCTEAMGMRVNVGNVARAIQWRIAEHLTLAALFQRIGRAGQDPDLPAVAIVFAQSKHILSPDDPDCPFRDFTTAIGPRDGERATEIINRLYKDDCQNWRKKTIIPCHKVEPALMWFVSTTGCRRCLAQALLMSNESFQGHAQSTCCDNCMYDEWEVAGTGLPPFMQHDITAQHCRRYFTTGEYQQTVNSQINRRPQRPKTAQFHREKCVRALNEFAATIWPRGMDALMFSRRLRERISSKAAQIESVDDLRRVLHPACALATSSLRVHADAIVNIIVSIVKLPISSSQRDLERELSEDDDLYSNLS